MANPAAGSRTAPSVRGSTKPPRSAGTPSAMARRSSWARAWAAGSRFCSRGDSIRKSPLTPALSPRGAGAAAKVASSPRRACGEKDRMRGDLAPHLKGIVLIAPAWDMTRLFWERAPAETRESILRDGVYYRPSAYGDGPYAITKALIEDGERHLFGAGPVPLAVPIRILHGCQDPDVPWRRSLSLLDVIACPDMRLTLIKDGEHRLSRPGDLALLFTTLAEFF